MDNEKNRNPKRRVVLHLCVALLLLSVFIIGMMVCLLYTVSDLKEKAGIEVLCIDSITKQSRTMCDDIKTIKTYVVPSDSIFECFVGHNPKIRGTYVMVYKNNQFSLKEGEKIKLMNQNAEGTPTLTLKIRVNNYEKGSNSRATMFVNTETFKTLGIEGKGLDQGVFAMQYQRIR